MKVAKIMTHQPIEVGAGASLDRAMELMDEHEVRHLPVLGEKGLVGVLSDRDLLLATGWLHHDVRAALEGPDGTVADVMSRPPIGVDVESGLDSALELLISKRIGCVPVLDGTTVVGIVTEVDVLRSYVDACRIGRIATAEEPRLADVMTRDPEVVGPNDDCVEAARLLGQRGIRHLPVVLEGDVVGILSDRDIRRERGQGSLETTLVSEVMSPDPVCGSSRDALSTAALVLSNQRIGALPIVDDGELVGISAVLDVMVACAEALRRLD